MYYTGKQCYSTSRVFNLSYFSYVLHLSNKQLLFSTAYNLATFDNSPLKSTWAHLIIPMNIQYMI